MENNSISLIRTKTPVDLNFATSQKRLNNTLMERKLEQQYKKNKAGMVNIDAGVRKLEADLFTPTPADMRVDILNS